MAETRKTPDGADKASDSAPKTTEAPTQDDLGKLAAKPNDQITMSSRDAGLSHVTNNLVPQEGDYVTSAPGMVPPKYDEDEFKHMDKTAPTEARETSIRPENRRVGPGIVADDQPTKAHVS
jgi:hypothetical protein